ncbi:hypothetical protein VNO77_37050 [Canavalia gladiata]|uniref:Uncharacterized protein n=1 Tax=Canavalia gladiata TaxID=3824 RepID=A0AAN9PWI9_CANGL
MNLERLMYGFKAGPHGSLAATIVEAPIGHAAGQGDPYAIVRVAFIAPSHQVALYAPQHPQRFEEMYKIFLSTHFFDDPQDIFSIPESQELYKDRGIPSDNMTYSMLWHTINLNF